MPTATRQLELDDARTLIAWRGFGPCTPISSHRTVGVELESFPSPTIDPERLPAVALPAGSRLTLEPGGQVELSSPPQVTVAAACDALSLDLEALRSAISPMGVDLRQTGVNEERPTRLLHSPRYQAMEAYFDRRWPEAGRTMMCATASVQVNLGLGTGPRAVRRWRAANLLGPVLAAAFSTSTPSAAGPTRMATWLALDPSRTAPVPQPDGNGNGNRDGNRDGHGHRNRRRLPADDWVDYALDANVMLIRAGEDHQPILDEPLTARAWIEHGHPLGWPTADDVSYHLTTLFPPVRPRGWMELRMIDALPDPWWRVPVAVAAALVDDAEAVRACEPVAARWWEAATQGLADPALAAAADVCAERAIDRLPRVGVDLNTAVMVEEWAATVRKGCEPPWQ
jgi:glutamate--cysteine ligase